MTLNLVVSNVVSVFEVYAFVTIQQIAQFKAHISELNLHAEAQASEYKQKVGHDMKFILFFLLKFVKFCKLRNSKTVQGVGSHG